MTDRDTFAAAALTGLIACMKDETVEDVCESAFGWADSMLRGRGVTEPLPKERRAGVSFTLTAEERAALERVCVAYELLPSVGAKQVADTISKLLERMK